jgi:hypothetical protein
MPNSGKGSNPNSHNNKPKLGVKHREVGLTPEHWEVVKQVGEGNYSRGMRSLMMMYLRGKKDHDIS